MGPKGVDARGWLSPSAAQALQLPGEEAGLACKVMRDTAPLITISLACLRACGLPDTSMGLSSSTLSSCWTLRSSCSMK